jgi:nucleoside phosphorylase
MDGMTNQADGTLSVIRAAWFYGTGCSLPRRTDGDVRSTDSRRPLSSRSSRGPSGPKIVDSGPGSARRPATLRYCAPAGGVDIAILTITPEELRAARAVFRTPDRYALRGGRRFYTGGIRARQLGGECLSLVITSSNEPHNVAAAQAVADIRNYCDPKVVFLVGIAAGDRSLVRLGDVVIPLAVHHYEPERLSDQSSEPRHDRLVVPSGIRSFLYHYHPPVHGVDREVRSLISKLPTRDRPRLPSSFAPIAISHNTVIAAGAKLLADGRFLPHLRSTYDERIVAADQESWGFAKASEGLLWAVFRGISDHGDPHKYGHWQYPAACCAALFLKDFLEQDYLPLEAMNT